LQRLFAATLAAALLSAACKVERTPPEYLDRQAPIAVEREAVAEELHDRLLALGQALNRGNADEALVALAPALDAYVVTPADGAVVVGAEQISAALERFAAWPVSIQVHDARVRVGPRANIAWFSAELEAPGAGPEGTQLRITGVYVRYEGAWQLVQAHVSMPTPLPSPPPANPATGADSLEGE
jgi:hypothetical protein